MIDTTWVNAYTLLKQLIIIIASFALSTVSTDRVEAGSTITVASVGVEHLIDATSITFGLVAVVYFDGGAAVDTVLCVGVDC